MVRVHSARTRGAAGGRQSMDESRGWMQVVRDPAEVAPSHTGAAAGAGTLAYRWCVAHSLTPSERSMIDGRGAVPDCRALAPVAVRVGRCPIRRAGRVP